MKHTFLFKVFNDLYDLINTLNKVLSFNAKVLYPGHGPVVTKVKEHVSDYIQHRLTREKQIIKYLLDNPSEMLSAEDLVNGIYEVCRLNIELRKERG